MGTTKRNSCVYVYLGVIDYLTAWDMQRRLTRARAERAIPDFLLLLQHPPTITIGKSGTGEHLLVSRRFLARNRIDLREVDRGGDITFHGPGQLVGYPILDLTFHPDVIWYLRQLEEILIRTLGDFQIPAQRNPGYTGVWWREEKVAAIGVKVSRWITMHGFALNVHTDLSYFNYIVPCGIRNKKITSMVKIRNSAITVKEVIPRLVNRFGRVLNYRMFPYNHASWPELNEILEPALRQVPSPGPV